jgi:uncharacterized protein (DUF1684 family)
MPKGGEVEIDFNKAYNPPCAYTPYATCPLPPKENRLPARIPAATEPPGGLTGSRTLKPVTVEVT